MARKNELLQFIWLSIPSVTYIKQLFSSTSSKCFLKLVVFQNASQLGCHNQSLCQVDLYCDFITVSRIEGGVAGCERLAEHLEHYQCQVITFFAMSVLAHCLNMHNGYSLETNEALVMILLDLFFFLKYRCIYICLS